ncbi:AtpZ/AtpI family protein [bacterium]|nr:MAG: AtpZ/AtpI family protein [bacterium]
MPKKPIEEARGWTKYSAIGLEMGFSVIIGLVIGSFLDEYFHTYPWQTLFWLICGTAAGMRALYRAAKGIEREESAEKDRKNDREG